MSNIHGPTIVMKGRGNSGDDGIGWSGMANGFRECSDGVSGNSGSGGRWCWRWWQ